MTSNNLNLWELIAGASLPVMLIMALLFAMLIIASFLIWKRWIILSYTKKAVTSFERIFWSGADLNQLAAEARAKGANLSGLEAIFFAGFNEFTRLRAHLNYTPELIITSTQNAMFAEIQKEEAELEQSLSWLATTGSVAPYVGLLGTVIGVMNSFVSLGGAQQVTLAQVAPGISEALIATAVGLLAAIPSVMAYNKFSNDINKITNRYETFVDRFSNILARQYIQLRGRAAAEQRAQRGAYPS